MNSRLTATGSKPPKLLDLVRAKLRFLHSSIRTEEAYVEWLERYIRFHGLKNPQEIGVPEIEAFLNDLAVNRQVSASTQNRANPRTHFLNPH